MKYQFAVYAKKTSSLNELKILFIKNEKTSLSNKLKISCYILVITYHFKIGKPNFLSQNPNNFINRPQACHKKYTQKPEPHKY